MKAVATALVLIVGAAVVLWYGNMLNSWVVGGLVGGLAAVLLSIPLSLVLFSHFAHHHDEPEDQRVAVFAEELFEEEAYPQMSARRMRNVREVRVVEEQVSPRTATWGRDEDYRDKNYSDQNYYAPAQLPAPATTRLPAARRQTSPQRLPAAPRNLSPERSMTSRHPTRQLPEYQAIKNNQNRSQLQAKALRAARLEASQQSRDQEFESYGYREERRYGNDSTYGSQRGAAIYRERRLEEERFSTSEQEAISQKRRGRAPRRERRIIDSTLQPEDGYEQYEEYGDDNVSPPYEDDARTTGMQRIARRERRTDWIETSPSTEKVGRSLVRRAPYLYDDDSLREEFAQYVQEPITRRSTRYLTSFPDEEEQE